MRNLKIDPEFRDKIPPMSEEEFTKLEQNILADGEVREPLVVWNDTIIDGHHRWRIIQAHPGIPHRIKDMVFADKWAAIVWMCKNQLGRRNLTAEQKTVLIGEAYKAQKMSVGAADGFRGNQHTKVVSGHNGHLPKSRTRDVVAKQFGVGAKTVERAEHFLDGLNAAEEISPGIKESVLSGAVQAPKKLIAEIRNMPEEKKPIVVEAIKRGETVYKDYEPARNATPVEERPAYNAEDFRAELTAVVTALDRSLKTTLVLVHREMLDTEAGRIAAEAVLADAQNVIEKYINMIEEVKKDA